MIPFQQNWRLTFTTSLAATGGSSVLICTPTDTTEGHSEGRTDSWLICVRWSGILASWWVLLALSQGEMGSMCRVDVSSTTLFCSGDVGEGKAQLSMWDLPTLGVGKIRILTHSVCLWCWMKVEAVPSTGCLTTVWVGRISIYQFWLSLPH